MTKDAPSRVRCRTIVPSDQSALTELLARGFPSRTQDYWARALETLAHRDAPDGFPRFGYLLELDAAPVGVLLMIFQRQPDDTIRCNISSWYVESPFRGYASLLIAAALRHKRVTYINISPAPHTMPVIEAQGFSRYCEGQMLTIPALASIARGTRVERFDAAHNYSDSLAAHERNLIAYHVRRGCLGFVAEDRASTFPFVFLPRRLLGGRFPSLQLVYCRDLSSYRRFAGPIGRALLRERHFTVLVDAQEKIPGLPGIFFRNRGPKFYKGPRPPRLGDLSYCESVLFGP